MAVAGIVVLTQEGEEQTVWERLQENPWITDVRPSPEPCRLVAVMEAPSDMLEDELARILAWPEVLTVDPALISYEDELAEKGEIPCPPHRPRSRSAQDS